MSEHTITAVAGSIPSKDGGTVRIKGDKPMRSRGGVAVTDYGPAFGPLEVIAYPGSRVLVGGLEYLESRSFVDRLFGSEDDNDGLFGVLGLLAAPEAAARLDTDATRDVEPGDENPVPRRDLLRAAAASAAVVGGATAAASAASSTFPRARFAALENPSGIRMRVRDRQPDVLPTSRQYHVYVDGREYEDFQAASTDSYGDVLPETTGTVTVGPSGAAGGLLSGLLGSKSQEYAALTLEKPISEADPGERLLITDNDILVDTIQRTGSRRTTCTINGESIPHIHESASSPAGSYAIMDGQLVYEVGSDPPGGETATVTVYASRTEEFKDDLSRRGS